MLNRSPRVVVGTDSLAVESAAGWVKLQRRRAVWHTNKQSITRFGALVAVLASSFTPMRLEATQHNYCYSKPFYLHRELDPLVQVCTPELFQMAHNDPPPLKPERDMGKSSMLRCDTTRTKLWHLCFTASRFQSFEAMLSSNTHTQDRQNLYRAVADLPLVDTTSTTWAFS